MNAEQFARDLRARRVGKWKWVAKCPAHPDRNGSLYITAGKNGGVWPHCYAGCSQKAILDALGIGWGTILPDSKPDPFWEQQRRDRDKLELLERQEGLAIMAQAVFPSEREHWDEIESTVALEKRELRAKLYPEECTRIRRNEETQRILAEYGDELWNCIPTKGTA
jgi:hypothetical protein